MKNTLIIWLLISVVACTQKESQTAAESTVKKEDLLTAKWIEGDWESLYNNEPFYESYQFKDDSTIVITSYIYMGTDSASMSTNVLHWKDGAYFLGEALNYKVVEMNKKEIRMDRHGQASNDVLWTALDSNTWTALLTSTADTLLYTMRRIESMDSIRNLSKNIHSHVE